MSSYPDLVAYHSIAVTLGQAGHKRELFDVIDTMRSPPKKKFKTGADPWLDLVVFHAVLNACVQRKQWEGVFCVLQQLKQPGLQPAATTYELVMELMLACGKYNLVHEFFKKVQKISIPNALTYRGKIDEAVSVVHNMERRGIVGYAALYYDFARCLCSAGRCQEALMQHALQLDRLFHHSFSLKMRHIISDYKIRIIPDSYTFNTLFDTCVTEKRWDDFEYVYKRMLHHVFHFDAKRHPRMILDACKAGKVELLDVTWMHLTEADRIPPPPLVKGRFCTTLEKDDYAAALSCITNQNLGELQAFSKKMQVMAACGELDTTRLTETAGV
ncbi:hypothetical protein FF1_004534 [Malus domestica]